MSRMPFNRLLETWLSEVPQTAPRELLESVLVSVPTVNQRRRRFGAVGRFLMTSMQLRAAATLAAVAVVVAVGLAVVNNRPNVAGPNASPSSTPSASPAGASPVARPSSRVPGAIVAVSGEDLGPGQRYSTERFQPPFTVAGHSNWQFAVDGATFAWFEYVSATPGMGAIVTPQMVFAVGGAAEPVPDDLVAWLQARTDLDLQAPQSISLGGRPATLIEGTVNATRKFNTGGALNIACPKATCDFESGGSLGFDPNSDHFELVVIDVDGTPVMISVSAAAANWSMVATDLDAFIRSFEFPAPG